MKENRKEKEERYYDKNKLREKRERKRERKYRRFLTCADGYGDGDESRFITI